MSTINNDNTVATYLFSKNRCAILSLLYGHPDQDFYLRQIARSCGAGLGAIQRELAGLVQIGVLNRKKRDNHVYFQANKDCAVFEEIKNLIIKTVGMADVLRYSLAPLNEFIKLAFIFGSFAGVSQKLDSDVDLMVIGRISFSEVVHVLVGAQEQLRREVNPVVYSVEEFQSKIASSNHFLSNVIKNDKIFLIGDEGEFARLAEKRLDNGT